jgi:hypothetical protein
MTNRLQVGIPHALRLVVCVAHIIANMGYFPAEFTYPTHEKASFRLETNTKYRRQFTAISMANGRFTIGFSVKKTLLS